MQFFFDTYALIEIINGNPAYERFKTVHFSTTLMNLYEMHYRLLRDGEPELGERYVRLFLPFVSEMKADACIEASHFKLQHHQSNISYVDALGYVIALGSQAKFLTGDTAFKGLANVEFVR